MNSWISLPVGDVAEPSRPSELTALLKRVLAENAHKLEEAITGGAMTVAASPEADAVQTEDCRSGRVRLVIGGDSRMTEFASFVLDWERKVFDLKLEGGG